MGKRLYVGQLAYSVTEEQLRQKFEEVGAVETCSVITDRETGRSRGFGFVEMVQDDDAKKAVEQLNGADLSGRNIVVNEARPQEKRERAPGGGGGGFGGGGGGGGGRGGYGGGGGRDRGGWR
jgi:RNA recognition motif-containing protein